jgi:hypothetical protein
MSCALAAACDLRLVARGLEPRIVADQDARSTRRAEIGCAVREAIVLDLDDVW